MEWTSLSQNKSPDAASRAPWRGVLRRLGTPPIDAISAYLLGLLHVHAAVEYRAASPKIPLRKLPPELFCVLLALSIGAQQVRQRVARLLPASSPLRTCQDSRWFMRYV